ncbi:MAG: PIN domain-containing protein [Actinobacteria bacterium]|nr:PIN domain-containing protein [Actinomycetota bacterium]
MNSKDRYLVDTDIIIYWLNNTCPQINKKIVQASDSRIFISAITIAELYYGAFNSFKQKDNCKLLDQLTQEINIINFDFASGKVFGKVKAELKKKGQMINDSDIFIAATAIEGKFILVSNNESHFTRIDGLKVENWV